MKTLFSAILLVAVLALSGCVFGKLDDEVEEALAAIENTAVATPEQVEDILDRSWRSQEGSAQITLRDGLLVVTSDGELLKSQKKTTSTRSFKFQEIDADGYARFKFEEGTMCTGGSKDCNRDVSGSATARFLKVEGNNRVALVIVQLNTIGDNGSIPHEPRTQYRGTKDFIVHAWLTR